MITEECSVYVDNRGFVNLAELSPGDVVYTIDLDKNVFKKPIDSVSCDFFSGKINCIDSGAHNVDVTNDARLLYESEDYGSKMISFREIPSHSANKEYISSKYFPVLSWKERSDSRLSQNELEKIARQIAVNEFDVTVARETFFDFSGTDALLLMDMLEFWLSEAPGIGWFERASVKSRSHMIEDKMLLDELSKIAVLAGHTAATTVFKRGVYGLKVSYESMPIPGSRPKNQKYYQKYFTGNVFNVNARNLPILGKSRGRVFFLPTSSTENGTMLQEV